MLAKNIINSLKTFEYRLPKAVRFMSTGVNTKTQILTDLQKAQQELGNDTLLFKGRFATIGNQSGGKSELFAAITGLDVFYSVMGEGTKRPNVIDIVNVTGNDTYVKFSSWGEPLYDENLIRERVMQANLGDFTDEPFQMTVYSPNGKDSSFVDLPGLTRTHATDADIPKVIQDICKKYVEDPDYIKLIVVSAANDFETSLAFEEVYSANQLPNSALVMTKLDLAKSDTETLVKKLRNENFMPGLGMFGVRLRSQEDRDKGVKIEELIENEKRFLKKKGLLEPKYSDLRLGVPQLRESLSEIQLAKIYESLPLINSSIEDYVTKSQENQSLLNKIANLPNLTTISNGMESLFDRLHPRSPQRRDFEKSMKEKTDEVVNSIFNTAIVTTMKFDYESVEELRNEIKHRGSYMYIKNSRGAGMLNDLRSAYSLVESSKGSTLPTVKDDFHDLTIYGPCDPTLATVDLDRISNATLRSKIPTSFFRPCVTMELSGSHEKWLREINSVITHTHNNLNLGHEVWNVSVSGLQEFVEVQCGDVLGHQQDGETVSQFFKYILEQISRQEESERVVDNINKLILCEARPLVNFDEMAYQVSRITNLNFRRYVLPVLENENFPFYYPVYGDVWKLAYNEVLKERVRNNVWRMVGVNVMNPLIRESFRHALEFFQQKNYLNEDRAIQQKVERLRKVQTAIVENYHEIEQKYHEIETFREERAKRIEERRAEQELRREQRNRKKQRRNNMSDFSY